MPGDPGADRVDPLIDPHGFRREFAGELGGFRRIPGLLRQRGRKLPAERRVVTAGDHDGRGEHPERRAARFGRQLRHIRGTPGVTDAVAVEHFAEDHAVRRRRVLEAHPLRIFDRKALFDNREISRENHSQGEERLVFAAPRHRRVDDRARNHTGEARHQQLAGRITRRGRNPGCVHDVDLGRGKLLLRPVRSGHRGLDFNAFPDRIVGDFEL